MEIHRDIKEYYALRAEEYERVYAYPSRQESIRWLKTLLNKTFVGKRVLEISCGTGYWTPAIAEVAEFVLATDVNEAVLKIAQAKPRPRENIRFQVADAFVLDNVRGDFDAGFAGFWWSHISKDRLGDFLAVFHGRLEPDALVVFADNNRVEDLHGNNSEYVDQAGNQYSLRDLENGRRYEIIKNFPTEAELREVLAGVGREIQYFSSACYWCVSYRTV